MIILGIDPGTVRTGWGVIKLEGNSYTLLGYGVISTKAKHLSEKYLEIFEGLEKVIASYRPDCISIETQFVSKNPASTIKIGMARGTALLAGARASLPIYEYAPTRAKKALTGSGRAQKEDIQKMIGLLLSSKKDIPHDAADALSLAICHAHFHKSPLATIL
ncbi:crossover junction endodeoxyribonuclease RuvC [bacterium]|nr:crossover junction endodeoxyribonuclease RuvC [bacterium]